MNRWPAPFIALSLSLSLAIEASAQQSNIVTSATPAAPPIWLSGASPHSQRQFPPTARRATMTVLNTQEASLNDKTVRLAPAARIRTVTNTLVNTSILIGQGLTVNYITDHMGQVLEAWILTEAEIAQRLPADTSR